MESNIINPNPGSHCTAEAKKERPNSPSMDVADLKEQYDHSSWFTAAGTVAGYGLILLAMTLLLFGVPYAIFWLL
jgi:hypothetical protein